MYYKVPLHALYYKVVVRTIPLKQSCGRKTCFLGKKHLTRMCDLCACKVHGWHQLFHCFAATNMYSGMKRVSNMGMLTCFMLVTLAACRDILWVPVWTTSSNFLAKPGTTPTKHEHETRITSEEVFATSTTVSTCCRSIHRTVTSANPNHAKRASSKY